MNIFGMGPFELLVIVALAFILFGPEKMTEIMGGLGRAVREFRSMTSDLTGEFERTIAEVRETADELQTTTREALTVEGLNPFDQPAPGRTVVSSPNGVSPTAAPPAALQPSRSLGATPTKSDPLADFAMFGEPAPPPAPSAVAEPEPVVEPEADARSEPETVVEAALPAEEPGANGHEPAEAQERTTGEEPTSESVAAAPAGELNRTADAA